MCVYILNTICNGPMIGLVSYSSPILRIKFTLFIYYNNYFLFSIEVDMPNHLNGILKLSLTLLSL